MCEYFHLTLDLNCNNYDKTAKWLVYLNYYFENIPGITR